MDLTPTAIILARESHKGYPAVSLGQAFRTFTMRTKPRLPRSHPRLILAGVILTPWLQMWFPEGGSGPLSLHFRFIC